MRAHHRREIIRRASNAEKEEVSRAYRKTKLYIKFIAWHGGAGFTSLDSSEIVPFTRENVARWLEKTNEQPDPYPICPVQDFYAVRGDGNGEIPWATEEGEKLYAAGMRNLVESGWQPPADLLHLLLH